VTFFALAFTASALKQGQLKRGAMFFLKKKKLRYDFALVEQLLF